MDTGLRHVRGVAAGLLILVTLSGCFDGGPSEDPPGTSSTSPSGSSTSSPPLAPLDPETRFHGAFQDCYAFVMNPQIPYEDARRLVPDGYEPSGIVPGVTAYLNLRIHQCGSYVQDNATVIAPFEWVETVVLVRVNDTLGGNATGSHLYLLEVFMESNSIAENWTRLGFPVITSEITMTPPTNPVEVTVSVGGDVWYEIQGIVDEQASNPGAAGNTRLHHLPVPGEPRWLEMHAQTQDNAVGTATVGIEDGVLLEVSTGREGVLVWDWGGQKVSGTHQFGWP